MFTLAIIVGIYSYILMGLGLAGWLYPQVVWGITIVVLVGAGITLFSFPPLKLRGGIKGGDIWSWGLFSLIVVQALVNLVGALGPEMGFDALWYHLPIPKIWLEAHRIFFIGGNLYYSAMPKLIDMLYVWGEMPAKIMHLVFGLLSTAVTYKLALRFTQSKLWSLLAAVIFYSNLVVGWQSITAYIDLGRTFFEVLAFYLLVEKKVYKSAVVLGLVMATKTIALGSLGILGVLVWLGYDWKKMVRFAGLAMLVSAPWYIFSLVSTGNPVYPIFSGYKLDWDWTFNLLRLADPINPIYVMILPLLLVPLVSPSSIPPLKLRGGQGVIFLYCLLSFVVWYLTPRTGGGRFLLPYLPVWSVATAIAIAQSARRNVQKFLVGMIIALAVISIGYRAVANYGLIARFRSRDLPTQLGIGRKI